MAADSAHFAIHIGFTGHRTLDDPAAAAVQMDAAVAALRGARARLAAAGEAPRLRLIIGAAPGSDRLMAARWTALGLGETHLLFPYRDPDTGAACTDHPSHPDVDIRVTPPPVGWTGVDALDLALPHGEAHAEVARWIVGLSSLVIGWWDGDPGRGAGGTADTLGRALAAGRWVIWIGPGREEPVLIDPGRHTDGSSAEACEPLNVAKLADFLGRALPASPPPRGWLDRRALRLAEGADPLAALASLR